MTAGRGYTHLFTSYDVLCLDGMTINVCACVIVGTKRGTLERNAGKQTAGTRVAKNFSSHPGVGICGSITSFGARGNGGIRTQLNLTAENRFHASVVHDQQDQVDRFSSDLKTDAATFQRVRGSPKD